MLKMLKRVTRVGVHGPCTQIKCLFEALVFGTYKRNILTYSHMRLQLYQSHSTKVIGLKFGKTSIHWVSVGILEILK